jgi:hypothetical protein
MIPLSRNLVASGLRLPSTEELGDDPGHLKGGADWTRAGKTAPATGILAWACEVAGVE